MRVSIYLDKNLVRALKDIEYYEGHEYPNRSRIIEAALKSWKPLDKYIEKISE